MMTNETVDAVIGKLRRKGFLVKSLADMTANDWVEAKRRLAPSLRYRELLRKRKAMVRS